MEGGGKNQWENSASRSWPTSIIGKKYRRNYRNVIKLACVFYDSPVEGQTTINEEKINQKSQSPLLLNGVSCPHQLVEPFHRLLTPCCPTISFLFFLFLQIYQFPECDPDEDAAFQEQDEQLKAAVPFAVCGSCQVNFVTNR